MAVTNNLIADSNSVTWTDGQFINGGTVSSNAFYSTTDNIAVVGGQEYTIKLAAFGVAWYDQNGTFISMSGTSSDLLTIHVVTAPMGATIGVASIKTGSKEDFVMYKGTDFYYKNQIDGLDIPNGDKYWANKKIAWYGTSIPNGFPNQINQHEFAYPNLVAKSLGCDIQNYCVNNGKLRTASSQGVVVPANQSFTGTNSTATINYHSKMLSLIGTQQEPDLFVFDFSVNDLEIDASDINNPLAYDFTSEDTNTFLGSYNLILRELFEAKPTARTMLVTHNSNDNFTANGKDHWKHLNNLIKAIGEYWGIPVFKLCDIVGVRNRNGVNNVQTYSPETKGVLWLVRGLFGLRSGQLYSASLGSCILRARFRPCSV